MTELSVVVPTFNEHGNVAEMIRRLDAVLAGINWEAIFVDDASEDGTAALVRRIARRDRRVRLIMRHNRRGLSSAVIEGALAASAEVIAVMDGDLQHDETVLPQLYRAVADGDAEIASASRFLRADGAEGLASDSRVRTSKIGIRMASRFFGLDMTDPLTGYFVMHRSVLDRALPRLSEIGFKVLLDLITAARPKPRVMEMPFRFRARLHGDSKLDGRVIYDFLIFFAERKLRPILPLPARFLSFAFINSIGILVHLAVLAMVIRVLHAPFAEGQLAATLVAMAFNYSVNNAVTYRDRRLRGADFYAGFAIFVLLCSVGIFANVGTAWLLHQRFSELSYLIPALAGALIAVVWNFGATRTLVWGRASFPDLTLRRRGVQGGRRAASTKNLG